MKQHRLAAAVALVGLVLAGCDSPTSEVKLESAAQKASYGIGLNMGRSLVQEGLDDLDSNAVAQGIEDAIGKKEQRLKDEELMEAFAFLQQRSEQRLQAISEESAKAGKAPPAPFSACKACPRSSARPTSAAGGRARSSPARSRAWWWKVRLSRNSAKARRSTGASAGSARRRARSPALSVTLSRGECNST